MSWLEQQGFTAVTLSDVWRNWHDGRSLPKRPVVFTFDDGYRSAASAYPSTFFCYPAGRYDDRVIAAVRRAGFLGATTTIQGLATADRPFELKRVRVSRGDGVRGLAILLPARSAASRGSAPRVLASGSPG